MPPQRQIITDQLTEDEKELLAIAVRLHSALLYREEHPGVVNMEYYCKCLNEELVRHPSVNISPQALTRPLQKDVNRIFDPYPLDDDGPRLHPVVTYVAEKWDTAETAGIPFDLASLNLEEVLELCRQGEAENPFWSSQLHLRDLPTLLEHQPVTNRWWLPAIRGEDNISALCVLCFIGPSNLLIV